MNILIIEARYYEEVSDALLEGAITALQKAGATITKLTVPGALEVPHAIAYAENGPQAYDGYVGLGCVIRGETTHYDYVCQESARALMDLAVNKNLAIGNGIITVENEDQAWARAKVSDKNKGGFAANAVLKMISVRKALSEAPE